MEKDKVIKFLLANDWELSDYDSEDEYQTYIKGDSIAVDISDEWMVFLGEPGDFLHEKLNLYTLIGVLMQLRQLPFNYKQHSDYKVKIVHRV